MKILVTGGAGFIASHVVDAFLGQGHQLLVIDDLSTGQKSNLNPKAKFFEVDIKSKKAQEIIKKEKPDVLNHHAAQMDVRHSVSSPQFDAKTNILGLLNLMEAGKKIGGFKKVIFSSTGGAIYGEAETIPTSEDYPPHPLSPYGISKLASEHYLYYYQEIFQMPFTVLRYGNVYGPRQNPHGEAGVVAIFTQKMLKDEPAVINGNGKQTRDFVYVGDVVDANLKALESDATGVFNIGTGKETNVNQIFRTLQKATKTSIKEVHGPAKEGEQMRSCLDTSKAAQTLNWESRVSLKTGLQKTVDWFRKNS